MKNRMSFMIKIALLIGVIYLTFFNEKTAQLAIKYGQLKSLMFFVIFYFSINIISNTTKYFYSKKNKIPKDKKNNVHFGIENIENLLVGLAFVTMLISLFGINPLELVTSLTIVAAAFAILTKEYIVDFLSGIYLSFSNTFEINDYVKIDNQKGKIVEISMLKVKILNGDYDIVIIPNSKVHYNEIINYTKKDVRLMTVDFQIDLKFISSIEQLEQEIISSLESFSEYIEPDSYNLKVVEMKMNYLDVKFQYKLNVSDMDLQTNIRKKTIREVFSFISSKQEP